MGLQHEHQRPDRDEHLLFQPFNLVGYNKAIKKAEEDPDCLFEDDTSDATKFVAV